MRQDHSREAESHSGSGGSSGAAGDQSLHDIGAVDHNDSAPVDAIQRALAYGIDISLLRSNLQRSISERLDALEANAAFIQEVSKREPG